MLLLGLFWILFDFDWFCHVYFAFLWILFGFDRFWFLFGLFWILFGFLTFVLVYSLDLFEFFTRFFCIST